MSSKYYNHNILYKRRKITLKLVVDKDKENY